MREGDGALSPRKPSDLRAPHIKLLRFAPPEPGRRIGLAFRRTSPRKADFSGLGELITEALGVAPRPAALARANMQTRRTQ